MTVSTIDTDKPRSLKSPAECARRIEMLNLPHMASLTSYVRSLRQESQLELPYFDPLDGGVDAEVLLLFEKPGPKTSPAAGGSGFVSRNNNDFTAESTFCFLHKARLPRGTTIIWNAIPWWDGRIKLNARQVRDGADQTSALLSLLTKLNGVILVGAQAARARPHFKKLEPRIYVSDHPFARVRARWPQRWNEIPKKWSEAASCLSAKWRSGGDMDQPQPSSGPVDRI